MRATRTVTACLLLIGITAAIPVQANWTGTTADQMISFDDNKYARGVQILYNTYLETVHVFWSEDVAFDREMHYGRSTDYGETWTCESIDRVISFVDGPQVFPEQCAVALAPDFNENLMIAIWSEDVVDNQEVHYGISVDDGINWSSEAVDLVLSDPATTVNTQTPSVAIDFAGNIHVVWHQATPNDEPAEVHYSRSIDGGATWSGSTVDRVISFPDGNPTLDPKIVVGADDRLLVSWREDGDDGERRVHLGISDDGGATWSSETADRVISQPGGLMTHHAMAGSEAEDSGIHVVYRVSYDTASPYYYEIYGTSSYDNGVTWDGLDQLVAVSYDEDAGRSASYPAVWVGPSQGAIAAWNEERDGTDIEEQHISTRKREGNTWSGATADEFISFPDDEDGYRPSISGSVSGIVVPPRDDPFGGLRDGPFDTFVAWTEFAGDATDNYEVHLSRASLIVNAIEDEVDLVALRLGAMPNPSAGAVRLEWSTPGSGPVTIEIFDAAGRRVRHADAAIGADRWQWNGRDQSGRRLPAGLYFAKIQELVGTRTVPLVLL